MKFVSVSFILFSFLLLGTRFFSVSTEAEKYSFFADIARYRNICTYLLIYLNKYNFYARKQLLLSARLSHRNNSVCPSVRPSVLPTGGSVENNAS